jgi:hypothetical protein
MMSDMSGMGMHDVGFSCKFLPGQLANVLKFHYFVDGLV